MKRERIAVIVEDEWLVRMELADAFEAASWRVLEASSGEDAMVLLGQCPDVGLLVTDIWLTGPLDGWDVAEAYRGRHPALPVIYASANPPLAARQVDGSLFIEKPVRLAELVARGEQLWRGK
jgi:DNA-binding response OmpR family regulator